MEGERAHSGSAERRDDLEWVECVLCGGKESELALSAQERHLGTGEGFRIVRCARCGLMYLNPRPVRSAMTRYYPDAYSVFALRPQWTRPFSRWLDERRVHRLSRLLKGQGRALDVGCGRGELVAALRRAGIDAQGIDPSEHAVRNGVPGASGHLERGELETVPLGHGEFDLVVLSHVLEHCQDPSGLLVRLREVLRPGGYLYVEVPNASSWEARMLGQYWGGWDVPRHCYHFSPETLVRLLKQENFTVLRLSFSMVPTTCAWGVLNLASDFGVSAPLGRIAGHLRPLLKIVLLPLGALEALMHKSGVMAAICQKRDAGS